MRFDPPAVEQRGRVKIVKANKDSYAYTGDQKDDLKHLIPEERKFVDDKIDRQKKESWGYAAKEKAKRRASRQQSADAAPTNYPDGLYLAPTDS